MKTQMKKVFTRLVGIFLITPSCFASVIWDNGNFDVTGAWDMSSFVQADDFELSSPDTLTTLRFWAIGGPTFSRFDGTIGWAFYDNNSGLPGSIITSGFDSSPTVVNTGVNFVLGDPIFRLDVSLGSINLGPDTYWLALQEGPIGSSFDGSSVYWVQSLSQQGLTKVSDDNLQNPDWTFIPTTPTDLSFQLIPEPGILSLILLAGFPLMLSNIWRRRALVVSDRRAKYERLA